MDENFTKQSKLIAGFKENLNLRKEKLKLQILSVVSRLAADFVTNVVMLICGVLAFLFASLTLGFFIAELTSNYVIGFGSLTGFYVLVALFAGVWKGRFLERKIIDFTIGKILRKSYGKREQ